MHTKSEGEEAVIILNDQIKMQNTGQQSLQKLEEVTVEQEQEQQVEQEATPKNIQTKLQKTFEAED